MTEEEAANILLGAPKRELLERRLDQLKRDVLDAYDAGRLYRWSWTRDNETRMSVITVEAEPNDGHA